jgi:NADPH:quinone reductase-like Zn-dependent oxidoreductase
MDKNRPFSALVVSEDANGQFRRAIVQRRIGDLPDNEVLVRVRYSSLNYKDALSATGNRGVTRHYPHTPGIDAVGTVEASASPQWRVGDEVLCTGYDLGMNTDGGFGQYIRVPASWLVRRPETLSPLACMRLGTAGYTAGLCVLGLEDNGVLPARGPVLVTGATGGVGSIALMLLHRLGYEAVAVTGKASAHASLRSLGAASVVDRQELLKDRDKQLLPARWAGVVTLCGNAASADLPLNVYPFILRGVHLVGVYSANSPMERRLRVWEKLAGEWRLDLEPISRVVSLQQLEAELTAMLAGRTTGRCVVDLEAAA